MPPHVGYALTPLGARLVDAIRLLVEWTLCEMPRIAEACEDYDQRPEVLSVSWHHAY